MIQTRLGDLRFDNPVLESNRATFSTYWQRALGGLVLILNALIASRNTGVTAAIATGATVSHGLAQKPKFVMLAPADGTPTNYFADTITSTTFRINYTGGGLHSFAWSAET